MTKTLTLALAPTPTLPLPLTPNPLTQERTKLLNKLFEDQLKKQYETMRP